MKRQNTVSFDEIFRFAKEHSGVEWNECNRIFFDDIFRYKGHREIDVGDVKDELADGDLKLDTGQRKAREVLVAYFAKHRIRKLLVLG